MRVPPYFVKVSMISVGHVRRLWKCFVYSMSHLLLGKDGWCTIHCYFLVEFAFYLFKIHVLKSYGFMNIYVFCFAIQIIVPFHNNHYGLRFGRLGWTQGL